MNAALTDAEELQGQIDLRKCHLRAMEWLGWPSFLGKAIVPILYIYFPWKTVLAGWCVSCLLWLLVRRTLANVRLATLGCYFAKLTWPAVLVVSAIFSYRHDFRTALLVIFTPLISYLLLVLTTGPIGTYQRLFMSQLGYIPKEGASQLAQTSGAGL